MTQIALIDIQDLKNAVKSAIIELNIEQKENLNSEKLFTVNQVRKRLGKAHSTVKKLIKAGFIKTTKNGLISEAALNEYLQKS